jgi:hypothetical protein
MTERLNLDRLAAQHAQEIIKGTVKSSGKKGAGEAKATDNLITKALGVLQENGVYACMLFLLSRTSKEDRAVAEKVRPQLLALAGKLPFGWTPPADGKAAKVLEFYSDHVCKDLDPLLLTKETYEQTLIYARYGAKAAAEERGG